jgi:hypothetical protein
MYVIIKTIKGINFKIECFSYEEFQNKIEIESDIIKYNIKKE